MSSIHGFWYCLSALILILSSVTTIVLTGINLSNLLQRNPTINTLSFQYRGSIGETQPFCLDANFATFAWLCGFMTIPALFTGLVAYGVKRALSKCAMFFLILSGLTAFVTSIITAIVTSLILFCHVTLEGVLPSPTLFIAIFSVVQSIASMICFFKVCVRRSGDAMDLKYGIEPIPDPWSLTLAEAVYVEGKPKFLDDGAPPVYGHPPIQVVDGYEPKTVITGNNYSVAPQEKRIVLNNPNAVSAPLPRQQLFPSQNIVKPFAIDRVGASPNFLSQHDLPFNCKPLN